MSDNLHEVLATKLRSSAAEEFVRRLRMSVTGLAEHAQYALFIGAGCSVTSGIPAAGALVNDRWIPMLRDIRAPGERDAQEWAKRELGIDAKHLTPDAYGRVMTELLPLPAQRQAEIEALCCEAKPGFGYATLAQLVSDPGHHFNVILTTNFDDLLADSLYLFTGDHPLVIHHGSLSSYIRATRTRPLIVKLHGHHQFMPLNTLHETQHVGQGLAEGVKSLLHDRGLIFIGYSGNDEGIRDILSTLPEEALPYGVFWVSGTEPTGPIRPWLEERNATWVEHRGFDELMVHVRDVFRLPMPTIARVEAIYESVGADYVSLSRQISERASGGPEESALKSAAERVDRTVRDWAVYELRAQRYKVSDPERAKAEYRQGLDALPDSVPLHGNFANFLKDVGDLDEAEEHYKRALELKPDYPNVLHDYAVFLWRWRGDLDRAGSCFDKAMAMETGEPIRLVTYGNFAAEVRKDLDRAEHFYRHAIVAPSPHHEPFREFARFMQNERRDYSAAQELYREALRRKPDDVAALVNYSSLAQIAGDIDAASQLLERAYAIDEDDANLLGAFGSFLWRQRLDLDRAEKMFKRSLDKDSNGKYAVSIKASITAEYAWFLARERANVQAGIDLLSKAITHCPDDPMLLASKASYLAIEMHQPMAAIELLDDAIVAWGEVALLLGEKANILSQFLRNREAAIQLYRRSLELAPKEASFRVNLAGNLFESGDREEALKLCDEALQQVGLAFPNIAIECYFYLFTYGPADKRPEAMLRLKRLLTGGFRSSDWSLTPYINCAIADGHPNADRIPLLARVISGEDDIAILTGWDDWELAETS